MKAYLLITFALLLGGQTLLAKEKIDDDKDKANDLIIELVKQKDGLLEEYLQSANLDSLQMLFLPNCHIAFPYHPIIESRDSVSAYFAHQLKSGKTYSSFTLTSEEIKVYDDIVLEIGTCLERYAKLPLKRLFIEEYHYNIVWKKSKSGQYRIRSAVFTPVKKPSVQ